METPDWPRPPPAGGDHNALLGSDKGRGRMWPRPLGGWGGNAAVYPQGGARAAGTAHGAAAWGGAEGTIPTSGLGGGGERGEQRSPKMAAGRPGGVQSAGPEVGAAVSTEPCGCLAVPRSRCGSSAHLSSEGDLICWALEADRAEVCPHPAAAREGRGLRAAGTAREGPL